MGSASVRRPLGQRPRPTNKRRHGMAHLSDSGQFVATVDVPAMIARMCSAAGCPQIIGGGGTCHRHTLPSKPAHVRYSDPAWRRLSRAAREAQPWCSFCGSTFDLTLDHVVAGKGAGGYLVLCRSCNSSKGTRDIQEALDRLQHPSNRPRG